jgi:glutamate dehydrogenase
MITADPVRRQTVLSEIRAILNAEAPAEDRDLLHAFAPIALASMPDSMALQLPAAALAARIRGYFTFVAHTMPPPHQLYRGLPGLHVVARNPSVSETDAAGSLHSGHFEVTIVETHTPDAPFIFESLKHFFHKQGIRVLSAVHPIFSVRRQWERIVGIGDAQAEGARELLCQFRVERIEQPDRLRRIERQVYSLIKTVFLGVEDFAAMRRFLQELRTRLRPRPGHPEAADGAQGFLDWLLADNYVLMGALRFQRSPDGFEPDQDAALGAFREPDLLREVFPGLMEEERRHAEPRADDSRILDIDYRVHASAIHHVEPVDDFVVREWGPTGELEAATLVLGRLAKSAFTARADGIPVLAQKMAWLHQASGASVNSHTWRETRAIFNHFPKRELLYADATQLKDIIDKMVYLSSDDEIAVSVRAGEAYHAVSVALSAIHYSNKIEQDLGQALAAEFGPVAYHCWADCNGTALLVFYFADVTLEHELDAERVRAITAAVTSTWEDQVATALEQTYGAAEGRRFFKQYVRQESRSGLYRELTRPEEVPADVRLFEALEGRLELGVQRDSAERLLLKLLSPSPMSLTDMLRTLQNFGLKVEEEVNIPLVLPEGKRAWLERLRIEADPAVIAAIERDPERLRDGLRALQEERATDDPLNALVLLANLTWREVEVLRTLRNHLLQIRPAYNAETVTSVLLRNHVAAGALLRAFDAKFSPAFESDRAATMERVDDALHAALGAVSSLLDDEILLGLDNLVRAAVRTNFYQRPQRPVVSVKVESAKVTGMVSPRPLFEIYVHSPLLEGIHLRGGMVARGGIRWSDRHDDFRTEILGLMKTQMVKNAVIIPVGSKGGFVLKGAVPPRPALDAYLIDRYREFVSGLLDVTDNLVDGQVLHPPDVVRHDGDDAYLVVAADKGTAHLSDTANRVSAQYGFWLGDAFASGGSNGYDHKKEAITARGAWECVRHHFRNLGTDVQTEAFTMAAIGDLSGDVFGNGVLLSRATRLVAAFNHQHIFLDPEPDAVASFAERQRMFALPRSTWRDYDTSRTSQGGGIFDRSAKSIALGPEVRRLLDLDQAEASGEEVVRAILRSRVDLLYNGGIGTYVKASSEDHAQVGDRSNDRVRVDASQLRARVVAEGGNLGFTQRGRIEFWYGGGLINTDALDNSGGVDMSDHEVNIKILLNLLLRNRVLADVAERNRLLASMTDEVSELVLADNANQAMALSLDGIRSARAFDAYVDLSQELVAAGVLDRHDDAVPARDELMEGPAHDRGLPRPLLCVMLGNVKNWAFTKTLHSSLPDAEVAQPLLVSYFPTRMREAYREHFALHPLRREIIATVAVNHLINHAGVGFLHRMAGATRREVGDIVHAYLVADRDSGASRVRERIRAAGKAAADEQQQLVAVEDALETATARLLMKEHVDFKAVLKGLRGTA